MWALAEEIAKYLSAFISGIHSVDFNEPIDALIYMITAALGFSAFENTLFLITPILSGDISQSIASGNMRFIGASLLHVVASAIIGYCIGREFFGSMKLKVIWTVIGIIFAVMLHTIFNFFILYENGSVTFLIFSCVWISALAIMVLFEKIKKITK